MSQTLYRTQKDTNNPYVLLNKKFLDDQKLSLDMKGFLAYVMTKPNDWHFHITYLAKVLGCCEEKIYKIINALISIGYCYRYQEKINNKFGKVVTIFFESLEECAEFKKCLPHPVFPDAEVPDAEKPALLNNDIKLKNDSLAKANERGASASPPPQEKPKKEKLINFGKYVKLLPSEYEELKIIYGHKPLDEMIESMNDWLQSKGAKPYKEYAPAIRRWFKTHTPKEKNYAAKGSPVQGQVQKQGVYFNNERIG